MNEKVGLGLSTASDATFATFFVGENTQTLERVRQGARVWLFGEHAVGKTHLSHALAAESPTASLITQRPPNIDDATGSTTALLIDDIDRLCGNEDNEYALFAAYEATDFTQTRWVVTAHTVPNEVCFLYRDLASRMRLFERLELLSVPALDRPDLLKFWAKDREIVISDDIVSFLLDRIPRTQQSLWETLQKLDRAAVLEERDLTIPFVRQVMGFDAL